MLQPLSHSRMRNQIARSVFPALLYVCISATPAPAQDTAGPGGSWVSGISVGLPGYKQAVEPGFFTVGGYTTYVKPGQAGADLSIGTVPRALFEGMFALAARGGVALPIAVGEDLLLLPSAGGTVIAAFGGGDSMGGVGSHFGASALILGEESSGLRVGVTWHRLGGAGSAIWLLEFGLARRRTGR